MMKRDKSEKEREALNRQLLTLEHQEEDYHYLKKSHLRKLDELHADFQGLAHRTEQLLHFSSMNKGGHLHELDRHHLIKQNLSHYYDSYQADLEDISRDLRQVFEDKREQLLSERNQLPWE